MEIAIKSGKNNYGSQAVSHSDLRDPDFHPDHQVDDISALDCGLPRISFNHLCRHRDDLQ